jgi:hypothetical protein
MYVRSSEGRAGNRASGAVREVMVLVEAVYCQHGVEWAKGPNEGSCALCCRKKFVSPLLVLFGS